MKKASKLGIVVCPCNLSTNKAETRGSLGKFQAGKKLEKRVEREPKEIYLRLSSGSTGPHRPVHTFRGEEGEREGKEF